MASKSLTALPSVVSVMAEKTVIAMKCHTRGFEKVLWPVVCIIVTAVSLVSLAVAAGTPAWIEVKILVSNSTTNRGYIRFGLFDGSHHIQLRENPIRDPIEESYHIFDKYTSFSLVRLYLTFALSVVAMLLCVVVIVIVFLNSYQTVTTWWKGPPMIYILSVFTALFGIVAMSVFLDYYFWEIDVRQIFVDSTTITSGQPVFLRNNSSTNSFEYLLTDEGYSVVPTLYYSFGLHAGGSVLPLFVVLLSWRLSVLLPPKAKVEVPHTMSMTEFSNTMNYETAEMTNTNVTFAAPTSYKSPQFTDMHTPLTPGSPLDELLY